MKRLFSIISLLYTATALAACTAMDQQPQTAQAVFDRYIAEAFGPEGLQGRHSTLTDADFKRPQ